MICYLPVNYTGSRHGVNECSLIPRIFAYDYLSNRISTRLFFDGDIRYSEKKIFVCFTASIQNCVRCWPEISNIRTWKLNNIVTTLAYFNLNIKY